MSTSTSTVTVARKWLWGIGGAGAAIILLVGGGLAVTGSQGQADSTAIAFIRGSMGLATALFLGLAASKTLALRALRWDGWGRCLLDALGLALLTLIPSLVAIVPAGFLLLMGVARQNSLLLAFLGFALGGIWVYAMLVGLDGWLLGQIVPRQASRRWRVAALANIVPLLALCPASFAFTFVLMALEALFPWL